MQPIPPLKKGEAPTPLEAAYFNRIVGLLNALIATQVTPAGAGKVQVGDRNIVIDLSPMVKSMDDRMTAAEQRIADLASQAAQLRQALLGSSITAICNGDGSITVTINFPGL